MLDGLESRDLCTRMRSTNDRRSHILVLTDKGRAVLARAKKLVAAKHEARLNELLGPQPRRAAGHAGQDRQRVLGTLSFRARSEPGISRFPMCNCTFEVLRFAPPRNDTPMETSVRSGRDDAVGSEPGPAS